MESRCRLLSFMDAVHNPCFNSRKTRSELERELPHLLGAFKFRLGAVLTNLC